MMKHHISGRTNVSTTLFSYTAEAGGGDWDTYNKEDYVPPFLDELIANADPEFLDEVYQVCGDNKECLYDALATNSTAIGASTASTDSAFQSLVGDLGKYIVYLYVY